MALGPHEFGPQLGCVWLSVPVVVVLVGAASAPTSSFPCHLAPVATVGARRRDCPLLVLVPVSSMCGGGRNPLARSAVCSASWYPLPYGMSISSPSYMCLDADTVHWRRWVLPYCWVVGLAIVALFSVP